ncbi:hypothetical protein [Paenibacillus guangzhouensis]|uniref:hypothetical protein n=1 Tax=Paenibacillus guangzhouensis TaxID=1473112 RepID=UPI001266F75C|nr:hypothetical protein [Paenibacillus guangzhouensis]
MDRTMSFGHQLEILRGLETYGYQVAHYLLQEDDLALDAVKLALLEVSAKEDFFKEEILSQRAEWRRTVMRHAIQLKQKWLIAKQKNPILN